jgi:hypothetical protein
MFEQSLAEEDLYFLLDYNPNTAIRFQNEGSGELSNIPKDLRKRLFPRNTAASKADPHPILEQRTVSQTLNIMCWFSRVLGHIRLKTETFHPRKNAWRLG